MKSRWKMFGALLAAAPLAHAADEVGKGYITPQGGYTWTDRDRRTDDDFQYGFGIGKHLSERWSLEVNGNRGKYEAPTGTLALTAISLDALRVFNRAGVVSPYVSLGVGYIEGNFDPGRTSGDLLGQVGLGLMLDVAESPTGSFVLQLRPEVKARWDGNDWGAAGHPIDYLATLSLVLAFGPDRVAPPVTPAPALAPSPRPVPVVKQPTSAPLPQPAAPPAPPEVVVLEGVQFDVNSAHLSGASRPMLDGMAAQLQHHPRLRIELEGHTDSSGNDAHNLWLSQLRADAVRDYLVRQGASAEQLIAKGYGETRPIADNGTSQGRLANRRVAMKILENPEQVKIETNWR